MADQPLVIYHKHCTDGLASAWIAKRAMPDTELLPMQYGDPAPSVLGRRVFCVDFSFPRQILLAMHAEAASLLVLDHHKSSAADLAGLDFCRFDMNKAGCRLTWEHFFPNQTIPDLVAYVEDRDLWRWALPCSHEVSAAVHSHPKTVEAFAALVDIPTNALAVEGTAILRYQDILVTDICKGAREVEIDGHRVLCAPTSVLQSEVGERLATGRPFSATWFDLADGSRCYSLRSRPPTGIDVSEVAKRHGGGGHFAAAGYRVKP